MIELPQGKGYFEGTPHLSPGSASMFMRCPEQWRRRYLLGEKERPGAALVRGRADHYAHETNFTQKVQTHTDVPLDDVLDAYATSWRTTVDEYGGDSEIAADDGKPLSKVYDIGAKGVEAYHTTVSPTVDPTDVEVALEIELGNVLVSVRADILTPDAGVERKTTSRKQNEPKPDHAFQAMTYATVFGCPFDVHYVADSGTITTPASNPQLRVGKLEQAVTVAYNRIALSIVDLYARFGPDETWPGNVTHPWACGFCGWQKVCVYK